MGRWDNSTSCKSVDTMWLYGFLVGSNQLSHCHGYPAAMDKSSAQVNCLPLARERGLTCDVTMCIFSHSGWNKQINVDSSTSENLYTSRECASGATRTEWDMKILPSQLFFFALWFGHLSCSCKEAVTHAEKRYLDVYYIFAYVCFRKK